MTHTVRRAGHRALLAGAFVLLAVVVQGAGSEANASPLETVDVALLAIEPTAQALYAKERGFFERQGIDANIRILGDPSQIVASVLSGDVEFSSFSTGGFATAKSRGAPLKIVAAGALYRPSAPTTALVAGPGTRFSRPRDLVGKRIGIDQLNTIAHIGLLKWLKQGGVSASDVTFVSFGFTQMVGPLAQGQIDAGVLPEPRLTQALARGARRVAPIFDATCANDCLITIWMARTGMNANLAARFRNAIQAAAAWANVKTNRPASAEILAKYTGLKTSLVAKTTRTTYAPRLRPVQAQPWLDVFAEFGVIPPMKATDLVK